MLPQSATFTPASQSQNCATNSPISLDKKVCCTFGEPKIKVRNPLPRRFALTCIIP